MLGMALVVPAVMVNCVQRPNSSSVVVSLTGYRALVTWASELCCVLPVCTVLLSRYHMGLLCMEEGALVVPMRFWDQSLFSGG